MAQKIKNSARARLTAGILAADTSIPVDADKADLFPIANTGADPVPTVGKDFYKATIEDAAGNQEIIYVRTRGAGVAIFSNVLRGQEGTTARDFLTGSRIELRFTAQDLEDMKAGTFENLTTDGDLEVGGDANIDGKISHNGIDGRITPIGGIIMYSGSIASIPDGWRLCDGTNGTIDLRDRFVVGAGNLYAVGAAAGSKDAVAVSHTHTLTGITSTEGVHTHPVIDPGHRHGVGSQSVSFTSSGEVNIPGSGGFTQFANTGISIDNGGSHAHNVSGNTSSAGESGTNKNMPPYWALAYIMCMAYT